MKTTLGELLLAAVRKDAKGAQRLFAQAGLQMEGQTTAAPAESAEPKLEANSKPTADLTPRIAQRAYELFEEGGHKDGAAVQNWKEAESEIRQGLGKAKSLPKTNLEPMPVGKLESKPETKDPPQIVANVASQPEAKATLKPGIKSEQ